MRNSNHLLTFFCISFLGSGILSAQATRTWVSGVGDDANPCSRTAPCKTFAGAISKTTAGGEIDALDNGGFGSITITKSITIEGGPGQIAGVTSGSGSNGIVVQAGATDVVTVRNLTIQGNNVGTHGIRFITGKALHIQHCAITEFLQNGIDIEPTTAGAQAFIADSVSQDNGGDGLYAVGPGAFIQVTVDNSKFENNVNGVRATDYTRLSIRNTAASGNTQAGFIAIPNSGQSVVSIANSTSANNGTGLQSGGGSAPANVRVSGLSLFINTNGFVSLSNGTIASFGNNYNSGSGAPTTMVAVQ